MKIVKTLMKKAEQSEQDPVMSLLEYRATPVDGLGVSPAQILYSRQIRSILRTTRDVLMPKPEESARVGDLLSKKQRDQKAHYDVGAHKLRPLSPGQCVRFELGGVWAEGLVHEKLGFPDRTYIITDSAGKQFKRNRKLLIAVPRNRDHSLNACGFSLPVCDITPAVCDITPAVHDKSPPECDISPGVSVLCPASEVVSVGRPGSSF